MRPSPSCYILPAFLTILFAPLAAGSPMVGVYYYPWYGAGPGTPGHTFNDTLRAHLTPEQQLPAAGAKSSRDPDVIAAHIDQSHQGNISMWSMSWWGPNSYEDQTIRQNILTNPRASELEYTIHYESVGRFGNDFANPNFSNFLPDFRYLAQNIWSNPNYMRINGRPVVMMYLTREYFKTASSWAVLANVRQSIQQEFGYNPYIIGDDFFGTSPVDTARAAQFDAITDFDVYGTAFSGGVATQTRVNTLAGIYSNAQKAAQSIGVGFVPTASPGYNDRAVPRNNAPAPRYLTELGPSAQGSLWKAVLNDAVLPHTDPSVNDLLMVNSFNEWHEDTQIEASTVSGLTNTDDSATGNQYTAGRSYEGYGTLYLDLLRAATVIPGDYNGDGIVDGADYTVWSEAYGSQGPNLPADGNRNNVVDAADYAIWRNAVSTAGTSSLTKLDVPEPDTKWLLCSALCMSAGCVKRRGRHRGKEVLSFAQGWRVNSDLGR
jgi:glycoprotein endo-alpha-1,2-mannosidase